MTQKKYFAAEPDEAAAAIGWSIFKIAHLLTETDLEALLGPTQVIAFARHGLLTVFFDENGITVILIESSLEFRQLTDTIAVLRDDFHCPNLFLGAPIEDKDLMTELRNYPWFTEGCKAQEGEALPLIL